MAQRTLQLDVDGRRIKVSHPEKVMYPETGTTKTDVIDYYREVAPVMIPTITGRPATRKRWVQGVGTPDEPGKVFFRKDLEDFAPEWVHRAEITHRSGVTTYPLVDDEATLVWLAQVDALEIHTPQWRYDDAGEPLHPDRLVLDLDPGEGVDLARCAEVALWCRDLLDGMGLVSVPVTSGSKGIHLYAALDGSADADEVDAVAHEMAKALEKDHPEQVVSTIRRAARAGKVLLDWSQNNGAKTTVSPYSLRGRFRPTVAAPRTWEEIEEPGLRHLEYQEVLQRVRDGIDPLQQLHDAAPAGSGAGRGGQGPGKEAGKGTGKATGKATGKRNRDGATSGTATSGTTTPEPGAEDALARYRSMRHQGRTPEPIPDAVGASDGAAPIFVVQEHHASHLHWDFRLEHDGVLVSWAVPKGPPLQSRTNRLAVQTEDHPLDYASFEGSIPRGEYGAGDVRVWDTGPIEVEKWRQDEIIVICHGRPDGGLEGVPRRYALIRTSRHDEDGRKPKSNWLLHLTKDQPDAGAAPKPAATPRRPGERQGARSGGSKRTRHDGGAREPLAPMLATAGTRHDIADESEWAFEMKWDGVRAVATLEDGEVTVCSRSGRDTTAMFPELAEVVDAVGGAEATDGETVLDGEIVALDPSGRPSFSRLQGRLGLQRAREIAREAERTPVHYLVFDVLVSGGEPLTDRSYDDRRAELQRILTGTEHVQVPPAFEGDLDAAVEASQERDLEGVVAKDRSAPYRTGRRSRAWIKLKNQRHQEVVVIGWRPGNGERAGTVGSLLLAVPDEEGRLSYAGRVGTGFGVRALEEIHASLLRHPRKTPPVDDVPAADRRDARWVRADRVGEVRFTERTDDGRLRHPVWRGWRPDKEPGDVRWED